MPLARVLDDLRTRALAYPEAHEDFPWGHSAIKIKTKAFVFLYLGDDQLTLSAKLPQSSEVALLLPFASPTGYGLGRSGWVTAAFGPQDEVPLEILRGWIDESFRAVAPAKISKQLGPTPPTPKKPAPPLPPLTHLTTKPSTEPKSKPAKNSSATKPSTKSTSTKPSVRSASPQSATKPSTTKSATKPSSTKPATKSRPAPSRPAARLAEPKSKPATTKPSQTRPATTKSKPRAR